MTIANLAILKVVQEINLPDGVTAMNIFYYETDFATPQDEQDILDTLESDIEDMYTDIISAVASAVTLGTMTLYQYSLLRDEWDNEGTASPSVTFTGATEMLPHGVAGLVRAYSANVRSISRKYLPGFTVGGIDDGAWTAANITAMSNFADEWTSAETISTGNILYPAVFDTNTKNTHRLSGTTVVLADPAYQRRRRPGVGI